MFSIEQIYIIISQFEGDKKYYQNCDEIYMDSSF